MNTTLTITEARTELLNLPEKLARDHAVTITKRGKPIMAILPWDLYDSIIETLEIMSDKELMVVLRQSIKEVEKGKTISWEKVKRELAR